MNLSQQFTWTVAFTGKTGDLKIKDEKLFDSILRFDLATVIFSEISGV